MTQPGLAVVQVPRGVLLTFDEFRNFALESERREVERRLGVAIRILREDEMRRQRDEEWHSVWGLGGSAYLVAKRRQEAA